MTRDSIAAMSHNGRMAKSTDVLYIGVGGHVVALSATTGEEIWRCKIKRASFVTIAVKSNAIYAGANGELFCIDPSTGSIRWRNTLSGLGMGLISFSDSSTSAVFAAALAAAQAAVVVAAS
jgi:outer membrane protein assembly factor BamB